MRSHPQIFGISQTLVQLAQRMRISRPVRIAQAVLVRVPLVIGYLRPLILLPAGVVIGLTLDVKLLGR